MSRCGEEAIDEATNNHARPRRERRADFSDRRGQGRFEGEERRGHEWEQRGAPGAMKLARGKPSL
jgi:hypothetical protein